MDSISSSSSSSSSSSCSSLDAAADIEAGYAGCARSIPYPPSPPPSDARDWMRRRRREIFKGCRMVVASPRARFFVEEGDESRHFLDSCFLCQRPLAGNRDIFMYRGDTPFCSEECRQEQIEMDEEREKKLKLSLKNSSAKEQQQSTSKTNSATSPPKSQKIHVRAGTVVAG